MPHIRSKALQESLSCLPTCSGVYEMKLAPTDNEPAETLYVGKAKNLKSRVSSYFLPSAKHSLRIQKLIEKVHHVEWTETGSELEALILENNLIKEKHPKFNILLRDDKTYAYIKITNEDFPRLMLVRKVLKDGAKYFGPKTSTKSVRETIDLLQDIYKFRSTPIEINEIENDAGEKEIHVQAGNQKYPCLHYHLKKCDAPCLGNISKEKYSEKVKSALSFLRGNTQEIQKNITEQMMAYAKEGKFELAAKKRDLLQSIEKISEKQIISSPNEFSADVIGMYSAWGHMFFHIFSIREGKIINSQTFPIQIKNESSLETLPFRVQQESLYSFLKSHITRVSDIPKTLIVDGVFLENNEKELWQDFFSSAWKQKIEISLPQKGKRKELLLLAHQNAESYAKRHAMSFLKNNDDNEEILETLQQKLSMKTLPQRMECYDISHFSGVKTMASMVVFIDGNAKNSEYRSFAIKTLEEHGIDDFKSLAEALSRRLFRLPELFPSQWTAEKIKRKKDFLVIPNDISQESIYPLLSNRDKTQQTSFYSLFTQKISNKINKKTGEISEKKEKIIDENTLYSVTVQNNHHEKIAIITEYINSDIHEKNETLKEESPAKKRKFLLQSILKNTKCMKYQVYTSNKTTQDFLESIGFESLEINNTLVFEKKGNIFQKDSFSSVPQLLVIDGGKGQLSATWEVLKNTPYKNEITICSLAKREEEVFSINENGEIYKTSIEKNSPEGMLLQRIRDEAHRFAITKNRTGREKIAQKSLLDEIKGVGGKTKKLLKQRFGSIAGIRNASDEELLEIVNQKVLTRLRERL